MKDNPKDKKAVKYWIIFLIAAFAIMEGAYYWGSGNFIWCSTRGAGCTDFDTREFAIAITIMVLFVLIINYLHKKKIIW